MGNYERINLLRRDLTPNDYLRNVNIETYLGRFIFQSWTFQSQVSELKKIQQLHIAFVPIKFITLPIILVSSSLIVIYFIFRDTYS